MEPKELLKGSEHEVELKLAQGKVMLVGEYAGKGGGAKVELFVSSDYFFDKLKEKIPGQIDDAIIEVLKAAVKMM